MELCAHLPFRTQRETACKVGTVSSLLRHKLRELQTHNFRIGRDPGALPPIALFLPWHLEKKQHPHPKDRGPGLARAPRHRHPGTRGTFPIPMGMVIYKTRVM